MGTGIPERDETLELKINQLDLFHLPNPGPRVGKQHQLHRSLLRRDIRRDDRVFHGARDERRLCAQQDLAWPGWHFECRTCLFGFLWFHHVL